MSQNVEIVQQAFEAWNRGDYPAALKRIAPDQGREPPWWRHRRDL
jgi:ketosteroid isomerase-like protein